MFITRECDYAVRVIRALAEGERLSVNNICEREDITIPFAYKILKKLQRAGIVKGYRGVYGGYILNKKTCELTLYDVYHAIDPKIFIIECLDPKYRCSRNRSEDEYCKVHCELQEIQDELTNMLRRKSREEILK